MIDSTESGTDLIQENTMNQTQVLIEDDSLPIWFSIPTRAIHEISRTSSNEAQGLVHFVDRLNWQQNSSKDHDENVGLIG